MQCRQFPIMANLTLFVILTADTKEVLTKYFISSPYKILHKQSLQNFCKKGFLKNVANFTGKQQR